MKSFEERLGNFMKDVSGSITHINCVCNIPNIDDSKISKKDLEKISNMISKKSGNPFVSVMFKSLFISQYNKKKESKLWDGYKKLYYKTYKEHIK